MFSVYLPYDLHFLLGTLCTGRARAPRRPWTLNVLFRPSATGSTIQEVSWTNWNRYTCHVTLTGPIRRHFIRGHSKVVGLGRIVIFSYPAGYGQLVILKTGYSLSGRISGYTTGQYPAGQCFFYQEKNRRKKTRNKKQREKN